EEEYLKFIGHTMVERLENHHLINNLEYMYLKYPETSTSQANVLYLLKDRTYFEVTYELTPSKDQEWVTTFGGWSMKENSRKTGSFARNSKKLTLRLDQDTRATDYIEEIPGIATAAGSNRKSFLKEVTRSEELYYGLIMAYGECMNR